MADKALTCQKCGDNQQKELICTKCGGKTELCSNCGWADDRWEIAKFCPDCGKPLE